MKHFCDSAAWYSVLQLFKATASLLVRSTLSALHNNFATLAFCFIFPRIEKTNRYVEYRCRSCQLTKHNHASESFMLNINTQYLKILLILEINGLISQSTFVFFVSTIREQRFWNASPTALLLTYCNIHFSN
jgi:hypothetical protein